MSSGGLQVRASFECSFMLADIDRLNDFFGTDNAAFFGSQWPCRPCRSQHTLVTPQ